MGVGARDKELRDREEGRERERERAAAEGFVVLWSWEIWFQW